MMKAINMIRLFANNVDVLIEKWSSHLYRERTIEFPSTEYNPYFQLVLSMFMTQIFPKIIIPLAAGVRRRRQQQQLHTQKKEEAEKLLVAAPLFNNV